MLDEKTLQERLTRIRWLILDVDGVMTDGGIVMDGSEEAKIFHTHDGAGIKYAMRNGIEVGFVTGRLSRIVEQRAAELNVSELHQRALKKWPVVEEILSRRGVRRSEAAYVGDDLIDLPVMLRVGVGFAVADAVPDVLRHADWITRSKGGRGAVREVIEMILKAQGKWDAVVQAYLQID